MTGQQRFPASLVIRGKQIKVIKYHFIFRSMTEYKRQRMLGADGNVGKQEHVP